MKKKGSALVTVIVFMAILLILGTAVSTAVVSATKFNKNHSEIIELELVAKSGLNIGIEDIIEKIDSKNGKFEDIKSIADYNLNKTNNTVIMEITNENIDIELLVNITKGSESNKVIFNVESIAKKDSKYEKIEKRKVVVSSSGEIKAGKNGNIFEYGILGNNININVSGGLDVNSTKIKGESINIETKNFEKSPIYPPKFYPDKVNEINEINVRSLEELENNYSKNVKVIRSQNKNLTVYLVNTNKLVMNNVTYFNNIIILCSGNIEINSDESISLFYSSIMGEIIEINCKAALTSQYSPISSHSDINSSDRKYIEQEIKNYAPNFEFELYEEEREWKIGERYYKDDIVLYKGKKYKCLSENVAQVGWEPDVLSSIWRLIT